MRPVRKAPGRRHAAVGLGGVAIGIYGAGLVLGAGQGHAWSIGHDWLSRGGVDTLASAAAVALGVAGLLLAGGRPPDEGVSVSVGEAEAPRTPARGWTSTPAPRAGRPRSPAEFVRQEGRPGTPGGDARCADLVHAALVRQLGGRLRSPADLPGHARCLVALAAAHVRPDLMPPGVSDLARDVSRMLLRPTPGQADRATGMLVERILERAGPWLAERIASHAYVNVLLLRVASDAAAEGTFSMGEFAWLKGIDRGAWYAVNAAGRPTCLVESAGVVAHFAAEREAGGPLSDPSVGAAMRVLGAAFGREPERVPAD